MIDKLDLVSIISKYHLNGVVEQVRWDIKNNKLGIGFNSPDKGLLGSIEYNEFPVEDSTIAIGSTSQLIKLIGITNGYLNIEYTKRHKLITQMIIADNQYTLNYALADTNHIPSSGQLAGEFEYTATAEIDNESIAAIVKAKQALADANTVVVKYSPNDDNEDRIELCFGGNIQYSNKVSFFLQDVNLEDTNIDEHYDSTRIKEVMYANKDMISGKLSLCLQDERQHMKLEFENDKLKSTYYLVSKEK
tara:strand:- start:113 stop:856 length:744 start_codon:yes stop_codon:yes gene_type:complete